MDFSKQQSLPILTLCIPQKTDLAKTELSYVSCAADIKLLDL